MFLKRKMNDSTNSYSDKILQIKEKISQADAVIIGAGAGLSTSAGFVYTGERFEYYFSDFKKKYGFSDIFDLVKDKSYFVLTTNADHCFQKAGFDKKRLFYTQGDYGLFQCSKPCHYETYDNEENIRKMVISQGFEIRNGELVKPEGIVLKMFVPSEFVPKCPKCGRPMSMNLRSDNTFVQDEGWDEAAKRYESFLKDNKHKRNVFLELGVGYNTPGIIKYPFWQYTCNLKDAFYICINKEPADIPSEIEEKAICVDADISRVITDMKRSVGK